MAPLTRFLLSYVYYSTVGLRPSEPKFFDKRLESLVTADAVELLTANSTNYSSRE